MTPGASAESLPEAFGRAVRRRREKLGLSQEELGFRSGVHRTFVSEIERGLKSPTLQTVERLAIALEVTASRLVRAAEQLRGSSSR